MLKAILRTVAARFAAPSFTRRRSFAGSIIYSCRETGEDYSIIPAGAVGFYVAGAGGRFLGRASSHTDAATLISADARNELRAARALAA